MGEPKTPASHPRERVGGRRERVDEVRSKGKQKGGNWEGEIEGRVRKMERDERHVVAMTMETEGRRE